MNIEAAPYRRRPGPPGGWIRVGVVRGMWLGVAYSVVVATLASLEWGLLALVAGLVLGAVFSPLGLMCGLVVGAAVAAIAEGLDRLPGARSLRSTAVCSIVVVGAAVTVALQLGRAFESTDSSPGTGSDAVSNLVLLVLGPAVMGLVSLVLRPLREEARSSGTLDRDDGSAVRC